MLLVLGRICLLTFSCECRKSWNVSGTSLTGCMALMRAMHKMLLTHGSQRLMGVLFGRWALTLIAEPSVACLLQASLWLSASR